MCQNVLVIDMHVWLCDMMNVMGSFCLGSSGILKTPQMGTTQPGTLIVFNNAFLELVVYWPA
jgi:hypothetical protein